MEIAKISMKDPCLGQKLLHSFRQTGFAVIQDHGIDEELMLLFYNGWKKFFENEKLKNSFMFDKESHAGYFPMDSEKAKDATIPDLKEFFHFYPSKIADPLDGYSRLVYTDLEGVAKDLLSNLDRSLPVKVADKLSIPLPDMIYTSDMTLLRVLHYPPVKDVPQGAVRAAEHEDINLLTVLPAATEMGLQVKASDGTWIDVEADTNDLVVNVGDMLQEATGGYLKSTPHRVVNVGMSKPRFSAPLFLHPRPNVVLSDRYTADSYLQERLRELGLK